MVGGGQPVQHADDGQFELLDEGIQLLLLQFLRFDFAGLRLGQVAGADQPFS